MALGRGKPKDDCVEFLQERGDRGPLSGGLFGFTEDRVECRSAGQFPDVGISRISTSA